MEMQAKSPKKIDLTSALLLSILVLQIVLLASILYRTNQVYFLLAENSPNLIVTSRLTSAEQLPDDDPIIGLETAPITIVEFSDFTCGYCRTVQSVLMQLQDAYPEQLRIVYRDFPRAGSDSLAFNAALAAECANDQGKFVEMHDMLFRNQPRFDRSSIQGYAETLALDIEQFDECMQSEAQWNEIRQDYADGVEYGVSVTPTFFINGEILVGAASFSEFALRVEEQLSKQ
jgi:protein-disulfide isomerase